MKDYYVGLDLGTGSLGWAVTDNRYNVLRAHGKSLWGVRLFESAKTSEERRGFRTGRRRLQRRNNRIELLQEIFSEAINEVDDGFFLRMKESRYTADDKRDTNGDCPELPYSLFVDKDYTDKEYHLQFPTVYHLRKYLMDTKDTPDVRLVYLALHHMMKHRGHFLFSGSFESIKDFKSVFSQLVSAIRGEEMDFNTFFNDEMYEAIEKIIRNKDYTKSSKKSELVKLTGAKTSCEKAVFGLICGGTVKLSDMFGKSEFNNLEHSKISFTDNGYDDYSDALQTDLGEYYYIIEMAKSVYDWSVLVDILGDYTSISEAKIAVYEKHKKDLNYLKDVVKNNLPRESKKLVFEYTKEKLNNYPAYIGMTKVNGKKCSMQGKQCSQEEFYKFLQKNVVEAVNDEEKTKYLREEIERHTFLPKQVTKDNGVIPYQIHLYELDKIIDNLSDRVEVLKQNGDKIRSIFTFRIPYYVGPLNGIKKDNVSTNWMIRRKGAENQKIYPWNFEEVVDIEESAERFIRRMTNKCTYLIHEDVLPKYSLLYSKFTVLNELNNVRLNGELLSVELKQSIYSGLFQRSRRVTQKKFKEYLNREYGYPKDIDITGVDGDFKSSLTAYHDFKEKLTDIDLSEKDKENIVLNITLFGDDKKLLEKRLKAMYPLLTEKQCRSLAGLHYKGWGRLSEKFLSGIVAPAPETGEAWTIIRALWETNDNLMQLLSQKYRFAQEIDEENGIEKTDRVSYKKVNELYVSPAVKRQTWQSLQVVSELCKVMGGAPKRLFIEMAREKSESKRTDSRKKLLIALYKKCKDEERDWIEELENTEIHQLRRDKLYLYYTQKGRCMYSGEIIELKDLWDNSKYDIDHIYPQSKVMDDSLDNRVLVKKTYNAEKTDNYPINADIRQNMKGFWKTLLDGGFISKEKYIRLLRSNEFEPSELAGFIQRQLVETRQSTKAVASILKQLLPDTEIVYVKAKTVSQFRQDFDLIKVREMNDLHHAKDAYLNIVVGNVYYTKFTKDAAWFVQNNPGRSYNLRKMFVGGKDIVDTKRNETAWKMGDNGTIVTVKRIMSKNNILVSRRSYEVKGGLFDQQLMKKGKGQVAVKGSDDRLSSVEKYGGYNKAAGSYFMLVESEDKKQRKIRTIEYVPLYMVDRFEKNPCELESFLVDIQGLSNPRVILSKIRIDTLFNVDGFYMWLSGRTGNQLVFKGANQLLLDINHMRTLKKVIKYVQRKKEIKDLKLFEHDNLTSEELLDLYDEFLDKISNTLYSVRLSAQEKFLKDKREKFELLSAENKCLVLYEILHLFQCQSMTADLGIMGGPKNAGKLYLNNNITKYNKVSIINQSPTGIYQKEIDLKRI